MLRIALCDDCEEAICRWAELIARSAEKHHIPMELACFPSGEALLFRYAEMPQELDILYLDILMDKTDGMETARKLRASGCKAQIIFLTSYEDYVYEAFDVHAVQYLLKEDTSTEKFERVFLSAVELATEKEEQMFVCEFGGQTKLIPFHQIAYLEIWHRLVTVHYDGGKTEKFYGSMEQLEKELLDKHFARTHRSYLVHLPYIMLFQNRCIVLKTGETVPVGVTYAQSLKRRFSDYISHSHIYPFNGGEEEKR